MMKPIRLSLITVAALGLGLTACQQPHQNPLRTHHKEQVGRFLWRASEAAERRLHITIDPAGAAYGDCMDNKRTQYNCKALYQYMLRYAKGQAGFKDLRDGELTDQTQWKANADDYVHQAFESLDKTR